jgi:peptidoglycan-N-acetylglucosamine deacetylase
MHRVILTFDDGPEPEHTPCILDLLAKENVQAVFFVLGKKLQSPGALDIVRRAAREGHLIGNHTFSHPNLTQLSPEDIRSQIVRTHEIISEFEPKRKLFRPPYGSSNETVKAVAKELRYDPVWWDVDPKDWKTENEPSAWVDVAIEQIRTRHRAICLCHDTRQTAAHLPQLFEKVKQLSNYQFVRYDHCRTLWRRAEFLGYRLLHKLS